MTAHEKVYVPGDVVETTSGVGVITLCPDSDDSRATFRVMLGREPGKSIATCSEKLLEASAVSSLQ